MKPKRKVSPRSFVAQVAGSGGPTGEAPAAQGKSGAGNDHDLVQPAAPRGGAATNDHDS